MSLPSSYSAILSDLNREVLRAQPSDPLQFCANWFSSRLEQERISARATGGRGGQRSVDESMREATPPLAAAGRSSAAQAAQGESPASKAGPSSTKPKPSSLPFNQVYAFGTAGSNNNASRGSASAAGEQSPFSEYPPEGGPFVRGGNAPPAGSRLSQQSNAPRGTGGKAPGSTTPPNADSPPSNTQRFSRGGAAGSQEQQSQHQRATSTAHTESDEEVEDPRDDPNYHPGRAPGAPFGSFGQGAGPSGAGNGPSGGSGTAGGGSSIPVTYNLGRRSSVSAESLDPNAATQSLPKTVIPKTPSQRQRIEKAIANNLLFRNLDEDQYNDVLNAMKEVTVQAGTEVIVQGAVGDFFYVVEEGSFEVWVRAPPTHTYAAPGQSLVSQPGEEKKVATYGPGGSFGELALMYNAPRAATVVATSRATMWALDRVTFRSILVEHTSRKRKMYEAFLGEVSILQELNAKERAKIADALEEKVYDEGEAVVVEGEVGKNFYIIESGKAEVTKRKRNAHRGVDEDVIGVLGKGDYFGELALINSAPRAATVRAKPGEGRLRVATLGEKAFTRLLGPIIDILARKAERSYGPGAAVNATSGGGPGGMGQDKRESFGQGFEGSSRGISVGGRDA
ncbi:cAMP-dependent protein kinase regulatory subunit [Rhodotorula toruloides]|uniref:cAMP-dependent protein kinase regulatory subunit n=1 Tax=Rhodotorula toruloides TaxID=5286 RepID=A0A511KHZ3_RHOTO|nr:cAMP-dependent protein kinase regulatory subunit [Rhodotorula toruloides]